MFSSLKKSLLFISLLSSSFVYPSLLDLLEITPSVESIDYVENKKQFQLHALITEQRHPKTWDLSSILQKDTVKGLEALFSVDEDITDKCLHSYDLELIQKAATAVEKALLEGNKIYVYGCGATGRLSKQVESCFWRPFWKKLQNTPLWGKIKNHFPQVENRLIGEMTGGDRALVSSLEGLEDLQLIGRLALEDHNIGVNDAVFAITEGGETSSVIGTILAAAKSQKSNDNLYFIYNNPNEVLIPLDRSRAVLENPSITKICLFTGPQAITGSTRMQATTSETFIMGIILEEAIYKSLSKYLSEEELFSIGWEKLSLKERIESFGSLQQSVKDTAKTLGALTDQEALTYSQGHFSTYLAQNALIPVFIDSTERSPTFRLFPLDTKDSPTRKSWIQVWTPAENVREAWQAFLGRPFKGLLAEKYEKPFSLEIDDSFLQKAALRSLKIAGDEQQDLYDFSTSVQNWDKKGPKSGDLGVFVLLSKELGNLDSFIPSLQVFAKEAETAVILVGKSSAAIDSCKEKLQEVSPSAIVIPLVLDDKSDPLQIREQIALKMLLNAHSTAVMGKLGRIVGNTMSSVNPSNLKLIGRATYLIQSHVNDHLPTDKRISYAETNAVLFDAIKHAADSQNTGVYSEVALSIIRLLEANKRNRYVSWEESEALFLELGLEKYLQKQTRL